MMQITNEPTNTIYEAFKMGRNAGLEALIYEIEEIKKHTAFILQREMCNKFIEHIKSKLEDGSNWNVGIGVDLSYKDDKSCIAIGTKGSDDTIKIKTFINEQFTNCNFKCNDPMKKSDTSKALDRVINTLDSKCNQYRKDPIDVLSIDELLTQLKIKVIRAQLTSDNLKQEDELLDVAVYAILTLDKMLKNK